MSGNAPEAMPEYRRGVLTPQGHSSGSPQGSLVFAPRIVDALW